MPLAQRLGLNQVCLPVPPLVRRARSEIRTRTVLTDHNHLKIARLPVPPSERLTHSIPSTTASRSSRRPIFAVRRHHMRRLRRKIFSVLPNRRRCLMVHICRLLRGHPCGGSRAPASSVPGASPSAHGIHMREAVNAFLIVLLIVSSVREAGIEPAFSEPKADVLPLDDSRVRGGRLELPRLAAAVFETAVSTVPTIRAQCSRIQPRSLT